MNSILLNGSKIFPSKVVCVGRNYKKHILELNNEIPGELVFFFKPNSSISKKLTFPKNFESCHYEAEMSFLIMEDKISAIAFGLDLTLREVQSKLKEKSLPWERAKAFDNSAVFSDFVSLEDDANLDDLSIELFINGQLRQEGTIPQMINNPQNIIKELNSFSSFENGDILMTGTPSGVGKFKKGDTFLGKILLNKKVIVEKEFKVF